MPLNAANLANREILGVDPDKTTPSNGVFDGDGDDFYYWIATLEDAEGDLVLKVGNHPPRAQITGEKYYDQNDDGVFDSGDIALEGWQVSLYSADADDGSGGGIAGDDVLQQGEIDAATALATTTTDQNGIYLFDELEAGDYFVVEDAPGGWTSNGDKQHKVTVTPNGTSGSLEDNDTDFLNVSEVAIGGDGIHDLTADGVRNGIDDGLADWDVNIWFDSDGDGFEAGDDDVLVETVTTDAIGVWAATLDMIGDYYVEQVLKTGWHQSAPGDTLDGAEGYYKVTVAYDAATLSLGVSAENQDGGGVSTTDLDFLNYRLGTISGLKYHDLNANGFWESRQGETGLEGWTVYIDVNNNDTFDDGEPFDITDEFGVWSIIGLKPSSTPYTVREVIEPDWMQSDPAGDGEIRVFLTSLGSDIFYQFGNYQPGRIEGHKYADLTKDGTIDGDEPGLANWTIELYESDGVTLITTTTTDATGHYFFNDLTPGTYVVKEMLAPGFEQTFPDSGSYTITIKSGETFGDDEGEVSDFMNHMLAGVVRPPDFWSDLGTQFWDGLDNETMSGDGFPDGDLLCFVNGEWGILATSNGVERFYDVNVGDSFDPDSAFYDGDGDDPVVFKGFNYALAMLQGGDGIWSGGAGNAQTKGNKVDFKDDLERSVIATALNIKAGIPTDSTVDDALEDAIIALNWLDDQKYNWKKMTGFWNDGIDGVALKEDLNDDGVINGDDVIGPLSTLSQTLDDYNNSGLGAGGARVSFDTIEVQSYLSAISEMEIA